MKAVFSRGLRLEERVEHDARGANGLVGQSQFVACSDERGERIIDERRGDTRRALVNVPASNKYPVPSNTVWLGFSFLLSVAPLSEPAIFGGSRRGIPTCF